MCYTEWFKRSSELEAARKAKKEAEELARRAMEPERGGKAEPAALKKPAKETEPVAG